MAQSNQSNQDSVSQNELLALSLLPETMKHIFPEGCLLRSPLVNVAAYNISTTWQKLIQKFQTSFPLGVYPANDKGKNLIKFHISYAVCLILKVIFQMIFKTCDLLC